MSIDINDFIRRPGNPFFLIAGPCAIESKDLSFEIAETLKSICIKFEIPLIFKASYRKANRSRYDSFTGIGDMEALEIISEISHRLNLATTTDIHKDEDAALAANYVDVLQIPAFLCRQTSLIESAAETGKIVNVKKGQFMSHASMRFAQEKIFKKGNKNVIITERGNSFGYEHLIVDFMGVKEMTTFCEAVVVDCTHSLQKPNQSSGITGGKPKYIETMASCALAAGAQGIFIETHPNPEKALSDGANMLPLEKLENLMDRLVNLRTSLSHD